MNITNGFRLKVRHLNQAYDNIPQLVTLLRYAAGNAAYSAFMNFSVAAHDKLCAKGPDALGIYKDAHTLAMEALFTAVKNVSQRDMPSDLNFNFWIGLGFSGNGKVIGLYDSPNPYLVDAFLKSGLVEDYRYSDDDKPKKFSDKTWQARKDAWSSLQTIDQSLVLFGMQLLAPDHAITLHRHSNYKFPSFDHRLTLIAQEITIETCKEQYNLNTSDDIEAFVKFNPAYTEELERVKERITPLLTKDLNTINFIKE